MGEDWVKCECNSIVLNLNPAVSCKSAKQKEIIFIKAFVDVFY